MRAYADLGLKAMPLLAGWTAMDDALLKSSAMRPSAPIHADTGRWLREQQGRGGDGQGLQIGAGRLFGGHVRGGQCVEAAIQALGGNRRPQGVRRGPGGRPTAAAPSSSTSTAT
jgi:hypothetical protein